MNHQDALRKVATLLRRSAGSTAEADRGFAGPSLLEQEPDLAKETARHARDASAWAAGGQPPE